LPTPPVPARVSIRGGRAAPQAGRARGHVPRTNSRLPAAEAKGAVSRAEGRAIRELRGELGQLGPSLAGPVVVAILRQ
jgi:hypothetical protein